MKISLLILTMLFTQLLQAKSVVLLSYFDPFGRASINNSQTVAEALAERFSNHADIEIKLCRLQTIFSAAYGELETCYKELSTPPIMVLGLGETGCDLKLELMMRNTDKTYGPDNAGDERDFTPVIPGAPAVIGLSYPLPEMYCALSSKDRRAVVVSNNAGSFVCNNAAFQMAYSYPEVPFGFIHVPTHTCRKINKKTEAAIGALQAMIEAGSRNLGSRPGPERLPILRQDLNRMRLSAKNDECESEFYRRAKAFDER